MKPLFLSICRFILVSSALLFAAVPLSAEPASDLQSLRLDSRAVADVIVLYEAAGHRFLYSTGLVRPALKFISEPPPGAPLERLRQGLEPLGLTLRENGNGVRLIVRLPRPPPQQTLRGRVMDAGTGHPLSGVRVEIAGQSVTTNRSGVFEIQLAEPGRVYVSHQGYEERSFNTTAPIEELLDISLAPQSLMDEIVVVSSRYSVEAARTRMQHLDLALLDTIPQLGEDPLRVTGHLPGMATIGVSAKPHIRGGSQDEVLVLFNNLELLEPFHLRDFQSVFSSFNPSLIQSIDVYTGGFPARYGDRMSGVMDIRPAAGQETNGGEVTLSLLNASAMLHGDLPAERGDWMVSARRGNLDIVTKQINSTVGDPSYSDAFGQVRIALDELSELDVGIIAYNDDVELLDFDVDGEVAQSSYRNLYGWAQLHKFWTPKLDGTTLAYFGDIDHHRRGYLIDEDLDNGEATVDDRRSFKLWALSQIFGYEIGPHLQLEFGGRYIYQRGSYDYQGYIERGELARLVGTELTQAREFRLRPDGSSGGVFTSLRMQPWQPLVIEAGLRWDFQDYTGRRESQVSPRLSLKYDLGEWTELRVSAGRFSQPEGIHELQIGDGQSSYQRVQHADHYILGWYQQFGESAFSLRTEFFYKKFSDPKRRFENLFNPLVLLPELASDRVEIVAQEAKATGIETTLRYERAESFSAWLSYSKVHIEDRVGGTWQPRAWDQGDTVSAGMHWKYKQWTIGATLLWHDGWRTTSLPAQLGEDEAFMVDPYDARLRDYVSLDLQISREWHWTRQSLTAFLEITNLLNRRNVGGVEYDVEELEGAQAGMLGFPSEPEKLLPLVPSIGIRWQF